MPAIDGFVIAAMPAAHVRAGPIGKLPSVVRADSADGLVVATRATLTAVTLPRGPDLDQRGRV